MKEFSEKNKNAFPKESLEQLKLSELFKPGVAQNLGTSFMNHDYASLLSNLNTGSYTALESFKNLSRSFTNINYALNNVNNYAENKENNKSEGSVSEPYREKKFHSNIFGKTKDFLNNKIRRRSIKNNKIVFVHSSKRTVEKEIEEMPNEEIEKYEENYEELQKEIKVYSNNNPEPSQNGKKPRGSRYRGVSRNGNQWQVRIK